jgi:tetratricopeptide (TPR) repeat protein
VRPGRAVLLAFALLFASFAGHAAAQDTPRPEVTRLLREGVALRASGKDLEALARFERALALQPLGRVQAQRALAEQALGRLDDAAQHLEEALASTDAWVARNRADLDGALATIRAQRPPPAPADTSPRADTQTSATRTDDAPTGAAPPGDTASDDAQGHDTPADDAQITTEQGATALRTPGTGAADATTHPDSALLWSGTAATVLGAAGAIVAAALATTTTRDYDARYEAGGCASGADERCDADYADTTRRLDVLSGLFHGALGLAAIGGALTLGAFTLAPTADTTHAALHLRGTF